MASVPVKDGVPSAEVRTSTTQWVFRRVIAPVVAVVLLATLLSQVDLEDLWRTLVGMSPELLIAAFVLYIINYILRAFRFTRLVQSQQVGLLSMFRIVTLQHLFNHLLPARAGELSYVYMLKQDESVTMTEGLATLFIARILDMLAALTLFLVVILFSYRMLPALLVDFALLALGAGVITLFLSTRLSRVVEIGSTVLSSRLSGRNRGVKLKAVDWILPRIDAVARQLALIGNRRVFLETYSLSLVLWFSIYAFYYLLIQGFGAHLSVTETVVASTVGILAILLPIHSFGGFGTTEASWTIALMLVGLGKETAISVGFGTHVVVLLCAVVLGALGMIMARSAKLPAIRGGSS